MDLALELGMPTGTLKRSLTERDVRQWMRYAQRKHLPSRRIELYLAQIAMVVAQSMSTGKHKFKLSDFLFEPADLDEQDDDRDPLDAAIEAFDFKPNAGVN